jgi:hypothetical protein
MPILPILGKIFGAVTGLGGVLGGQQKGAGDAMATQGQVQNQFDRNAIDSYGTAQGAQFTAADQDLKRKSYETQHRSSAGKEALLALLMGNHQPSSVSIAGIPQAQISGGMGETIKNNPQILELLKSIAAKGTADQAAPMSFTGGSILKPPTQTPLPQAGKSDSILNTIARIAQLAGSAAPMFKQGGG